MLFTRSVFFLGTGLPILPVVQSKSTQASHDNERCLYRKIATYIFAVPQQRYLCIECTCASVGVNSDGKKIGKLL